MNNSTIRNIIFLAFISLGGIIITQIFWVKKNLDYKNERFINNAIVATRNIINEIVVKSNINDVFYKIDMDKENQFIITFSKPIPLDNFERLLYKEYKINNIKTNIVYIVKDFNTTQIRKGTVSLTNSDFIPQNFHFDAIAQYIELNLDRQTTILLDYDIKLLAFFSFVLLVVLGFFSYTTIVILRQKQLSEIKTDFVNNMTHEFKTPIATIGLSSSVLMKDEITQHPEKLKHYATIINEENERLRKQVESVLQVSQIESKKIMLNVEQIDLNKLIVEICKNFKPRVTEQEGELIVDLKADHHLIRGDEVHIKNILFNLLDNALKYSNKTPKIIVNTQNKKNYCIINVEDNGKGIADKDVKKIFDKFHRVASGNIHDVKGFGLGLFYVKNMMELHKGFVTLKSKLDVGTTFTLGFPIIKKNT